MTRGWIVGAAVAALCAANLGAWWAATRPGGEVDPFWAALESVRLPGRADVAPSFPDAIREDEGRRVRVTGVAFLNPEGMDGDRARWFVLMPPNRYGCCGISCDPRPELNVYVDCSSSPWPSGGAKQAMVEVEGRLRLERGIGSWCLTALEDAVVTAAQP